MLSVAPIALPQAAADEVKSYLRIAGSDEDALVVRLIRSAAELCERFTGRTVMARSCTEVMAASQAWARLTASPVRSISAVEGLQPDGSVVALAAEAYAIDVDANGDGWVRLPQPVAPKRVRVTYEAGLAAEWTQVPETLRQGAVRLAAHLYSHRDDEQGAGPPAAVTALWRPWRRMRLR